jgi:hypothetical protein
VADEPKPQPGAFPGVVAPEVKDVPPAFAEVIKERNKLHKRQTGALLTITAQWVHDPGLEPAIRINWSIDYDGPRRPFIVLTPDLSFTAAGQTSILFWHLDAEGRPVEFTIKAMHNLGPRPLKRKEWFSVSEGGKPVAGRIGQGGSYLKGYFSGRMPAPGEPRLWVQLEHAPTDRGDSDTWSENKWTLDGWTGQLWSQVVEVATK